MAEAAGGTGSGSVVAAVVMGWGSAEAEEETGLGSAEAGVVMGWGSEEAAGWASEEETAAQLRSRFRSSRSCRCKSTP